MSYIILEDIYENVKEVKKYSLTEADVLILYANHELIKKAILCKMTSVQIALGQGAYRGKEEAIYQCIEHMVKLSDEIGTDYKNALDKLKLSREKPEE